MMKDMMKFEMSNIYFEFGGGGCQTFIDFKSSNKSSTSSPAVRTYSIESVVLGQPERRDQTIAGEGYWDLGNWDIPSNSLTTTGTFKHSEIDSINCDPTL